MPRRALPPNREALEAALTPAQLAALVELCRVLGVSRTGWHRLAAFRCFTLAAVTNLSAELRAAGSTREAALLTARVRLGLSPDSVKSWLRRAILESREPSVQPALGDSAAAVA